MNKSFKFPQLLLTVVAASGMFLPLIAISANGLSDSISFFSANTDGKIIFGLIAVAAVILFFKNEENKVLGVIALLFITGAGVFFWVDMSKVADGISYVKMLSGNAIHYGIGYYMTLVGLVISFILGVVELIMGSRTNEYRAHEYVDIPIPNNQNNPGNQYIIPTNTALNQPMNNQNNTNNQINNEKNQVKNEIKLSDLLNRNSVNANIENHNNEVNIEKPINDINNINNNTN